MSDSVLETRIEGRIGVMTLNRPQVLNAFNSALVGEIGRALAAFDADPAVSAIVVHGNGRAFSAGFDLKESAAKGPLDNEQWRELIELDFDFIMQFWDCATPTIAAVHGFCLAGAFELALACDITVAAEGTRFGEPEVRFGSGIVALLLPWITGPKQAKELLLTGNDQITAERALQMGIVNHVVPQGEHLQKAMQIAQDIAAAAPRSVQMTKRAINRSFEIMGMRQALLAAVQTDVFIESSAGPERTEFNRIRKEQGLKAALAWRDARFK
ncbi:MAG TPA: enoyl-CoA hydratase/isomerase family protein [Stellaceae bacterium]|jgi:enoyl-CoA hydratase|nr:enoyl-CoA hydratase/isomerase family protein [Stellaceae bacterium]